MMKIMRSYHDFKVLKIFTQKILCLEPRCFIRNQCLRMHKDEWTDFPH